MQVTEILQKITAGEIAGWAVVGIVILLSLIQVSPLKWDPWDRILGWFGKKSHGDLQEKLENLEKHTRDIWIYNHRSAVIQFARECREKVSHDAEEWATILTMADEYESFCVREKIANGLVKADTEYIRGLYQELSRDHKI